MDSLSKAKPGQLRTCCGREKRMQSFWQRFRGSWYYEKVKTKKKGWSTSCHLQSSTRQPSPLTLHLSSQATRNVTPRQKSGGSSLMNSVNCPKRARVTSTAYKSQPLPFWYLKPPLLLARSLPGPILPPRSAESPVSHPDEARNRWEKQRSYSRLELPGAIHSQTRSQT